MSDTSQHNGLADCCSDDQRSQRLSSDCASAKLKKEATFDVHTKVTKHAR